jgi:hypothetical protein
MIIFKSTKLETFFSFCTKKFGVSAQGLSVVNSEGITVTDFNDLKNGDRLTVIQPPSSGNSSESEKSPTCDSPIILSEPSINRLKNIFPWLSREAIVETLVRLCFFLLVNSQKKIFFYSVK